MLTKEQIAKVCHDINKAYCEALGDTSQPTWENAPQWQKDSAMLGVELHTNNPDAGPDDSHNSWLKQKADEGWKYGPVKNPDLKEHPCFVPYQELPKEQQAKDFIFRAVVHSLNSLKEVDLPLTITQEYVDAVCGDPKDAQYHLFPQTNHTICLIKLPNGSTVTGESVCAANKIFNEKLGKDYAFEAVKKKVWELEGYSLCEKRFQAGLPK